MTSTRQSHIRLGTKDEIPVWVALSKGRYPGRDVEATKKWIERCIDDPSRLVLVGRACAGVAAINLHFGIEPRAYLVVLYSVPDLAPGLEAMDMMKMMVAWAKENGAKPPFIIDADEGTDFGPFVKRIGGHLDEKPRYVIPF